MRPQPIPTQLPGVNGPSQMSTTVGLETLPPNWPHAPTAPDANEGGWDNGWTDNGWADDVVQPIGGTTSKPQITLLEYYPGIAVKSINPTTFACSRDDFYFAPHPTSCQKYFICSNRQLHEHQCGSGIQWDYVHSQCEFIERAACFSRVQQQHENGSFNGSVPANHEIDSNILVDDGVEGVLDPEFGSSEGTIDPEDPNFNPNYTSEPPSNTATDHETVEEIDLDHTTTPQETDSDSEITGTPVLNETTAAPDYTVTTPSNVNEPIYTVGIPEWEDVPDSKESWDDNNHLPSKNRRRERKTTTINFDSIRRLSRKGTSILPTFE